MSYYMGDFYRGDPGIGSFFGGLIKKVAGVASSFIPGVGPAISKGIESLGAGRAGEIVKAAKGAIIKHPVLSAAGAAGAMAGMGAVAEHHLMAGGAPARGMHPCKGLRPGHKPRPCKHGDMVPNRRMNPFNPRAARRAARRLHSLVRHYRKYIGFVSARRPKGRPFIKRRRK